MLHWRGTASYVGGKNMKKITLLGDSIRQIGYGSKVGELLGANFKVWQPKENCRFCKFTLKGVMRDWRSYIEGSDLIHWNNGLWDTMDYGDGVFTSPDEYVSNMLRIAEILKKCSPTVIFATTTPVTPEYLWSDVERIQYYNSILVPELRKMNIIINDLYSFVYPDLDLFIRKDDHIHLTEEGILACAQEIKQVILENISC